MCPDLLQNENTDAHLSNNIINNISGNDLNLQNNLYMPIRHNTSHVTFNEKKFDNENKIS